MGIFDFLNDDKIKLEPASITDVNQLKLERIPNDDAIEAAGIIEKQKEEFNYFKDFGISYSVLDENYKLDRTNNGDQTDERILN